MKSVIICIAPDLESLKKVVIFINEDFLYFSTKQVLYYRVFDTKRSANSYFALDLVKPDYMYRERLDQIVAGKLNEFNVGNVNLSIRTGDAMIRILNYIKSCTPFSVWINLIQQKGD